MKEALGGISIFQIVIFFILLFTGIMCLTINHAKAFGVKDEIINIIEVESEKKITNDYKLNDNTIKEIASKLSEMGYRHDGKCPDGWDGYDRSGEQTSGKDASFCIRANKVDKEFNNDAKDKCAGNKCQVLDSNYPKMVYYDIALFYQLDIPLVTAINFRVYGSTKVIFG